jgi:secondary thiamine-phosphate synthase enzyme
VKVVEKNFRIGTHRHSEMIDITHQVASLVAESGITDGDVVVYCPHTTAAIAVNENADPSVMHDILLTLEDLMPRRRPGYRHSEGNSDAHCKSAIIGCSRQILVRGKSLNLGTWQGIFFCEFDGPRSRQVIVQVRGE